MIKLQAAVSKTLAGCLLIFILLLALCPAARANDLEAKVDQYIAGQMNNLSFSGAILIAVKGKILLAKGYGMANLELDVPNSPEIKFHIGSITKSITAVAIMQLKEKGLLKIDDPLSKYIPDYPNGDRITIKNLLTHTSGIPNYTEFPELEAFWLLPATPAEIIQTFKDKPLEFEPGEKFKYCNSGYVLLTYILEKLTGRSYEDYLDENIFAPLGMNNSGFDHPYEILKNRASGYVISSDHLENADYGDLSVASGAGAVYSTLFDLYLWDRALYTDKLLSKKSRQEIFTPFKAGYGYGWFITKNFGRKLITHDGGTDGFRCNLSRYVDDDACIITLSNLYDAPVGRISSDLAAIAFGEKYRLPGIQIPVKVDPKIFDAYQGQYQLAKDQILTVFKMDDRLYAQATNQNKAQIYPGSEIDFFYKVVDAGITFVRNDSGEVTGLILHQNGQDINAPKIK